MNTPAYPFDNRLLHALPGDPERGPRRREVLGAAWSSVLPTPVADPRLLAWWPEVADTLGLQPGWQEDPGMAQVLGGNALLPGMQPWAANYGGHQFGHWAGQLGDGRAISLGELVAPDGEHWELQLKGAGPTPYSRGADGRAVLRSSIREFLCSEAMHHLGVPTTRALSLVSTGQAVVRDMFYDGNAQAEPGAVVCRVAPSFLRFGSFELPAARGDITLLRQLVDACIARDFPWLDGQGEALHASWFRCICERTAVMIAHWMRVGFVHGVMNTDNMSVLGLTIDYGPYGWMEPFEPGWTPNTTDAQGRRYRFGHQPQVAYWNLGRLAQALSVLFTDTGPLQAGLAAYQETFTACTRRDVAARFGLDTASDADLALYQRWLQLMEQGAMDMTLAWRGLMQLDLHAPQADVLAGAFYDPARRESVQPALYDWLHQYAQRRRDDVLAPAAQQAKMAAANPLYVLRNWLAQEAIDRAMDGDMGGVLALQNVLRDPYTQRPGLEHYASPRPAWAEERAGCSMLSCSS
ncbi:YdiU family protein [Stenotrophomonas sp. C3(2023)]|uniref:protein adenylyltransferase SelO n=1 Tax=Stenotrophomonas sp. C3(2023) TaxID=3080277 RepID=UPI00293C5E9E|nr:YdiU family protein [Stenotrophomonas sp. C3(2023)]MDV3468955.1 YdiU family protein [Stenotrophomonas sp. C3(2023)]